MPHQFTPYTFEQLTVGAAAVALTASVYNSVEIGPRFAVISVETNPLRYRVDNVDPTAAIGHPVAAGQQIDVPGREAIKDMRLIRSGAADAVIDVTYYY